LATRQQIEEIAIELEPMPGGHADALRGVHILVVEDDAATQLAYVRMLTASGAEVAKASTAEEALAAYSESAPDIILSDVGLPQQDGYELLRRIRELERERGASPTPAIALTAFAGPQHRRQAAAAGFQAHVAKPVRLADLISAVARYTRKSD
jgi:CheY-like chemotaxis protein